MWDNNCVPLTLTVTVKVRYTHAHTPYTYMCTCVVASESYLAHCIAIMHCNALPLSLEGAG